MAMRHAAVRNGAFVACLLGVMATSPLAAEGWDLFGSRKATAPPVVAAPPPPPPVPQFVKTQDVTLRASWKGLGLVDISINMIVGPETYKATMASAPTGAGGFLSSLSKNIKKSTTYASESSGTLSATSLQSLFYQHKGGKKDRLVKVTWTPRDVTTTSTPELGHMGDPPATLAQKLEGIDGLAALVKLAVGSPAGPCTETLKTFDGRSRFNLVMKPLNTETIKVPGYEGKALKCQATYVRVAGFKKLDEGEKPLFVAPIYFWLAEGQSKLLVPVKIETESTAGKVILAASKMSGRVQPLAK